MSSHIVRVFALLVVASSCGPELADPPIVLSDKASVNKIGTTWYFVSPVVTTYPTNAAQVQYVVRVRDLSGAFMATAVSQTVTYSGPLTQVEVPIIVKAQVPAGVPVTLVLEVMGMSWNGFEDGITIKSQNYNFVTR